MFDKYVVLLYSFAILKGEEMSKKHSRKNFVVEIFSAMLILTLFLGFSYKEYVRDVEMILHAKEDKNLKMKVKTLVNNKYVDLLID